MQGTLARFRTAPGRRVLQLTCVYGCLTPKLNQILGKQTLHLTDVADVQLQLARSKVSASTLRPTRMNAEQLGYKDDAFHTNHAHYGEMDFFSWANMKDLRFSLKTSPVDGLTFIGNAHFLYLAEARGGLGECGRYW